MKVRWVTGLFRLWVALSVPWVGFCGVAWYDSYRSNVESYEKNRQEGEPWPVSAGPPPGAVPVDPPQSGRPTFWSGGMFWAGMMVGPPIGLLVSGLVGYWVLRGFRPRPD